MRRRGWWWLARWREWRRERGRTGVRTMAQAAAGVQRERYASSDASGGASGGVVGGARCLRNRAAEPNRNRETHPAHRPRTATKERGPPADSPRTARVASRSACVRAPARGARAPRQRAGGARERRARSDGQESRTKNGKDTTARENGPARLRRREPPTHDARAPPAASATAADRIRRLRRRRRRRRHVRAARAPPPPPLPPP